MNSSLFIILGTMVFAIYLGIRARKGKDMNLEQWSVGGRSFGVVLVFLLMAGESYTTFTFLGASGTAYRSGGSSYYMCLLLPYIMGYWLLPVIWKYARDYRLVSQSDFFVSKYNSKPLGVFVSIIGVIAMVPYLVLQLKGLGNIVSQMSYGVISPALSIVLSVIVMTIFVMISGIHGSAWTAALKDILVFFVVVFLGIYIPIHYYGGYESMFLEINKVNQNFLALPETGMSGSWFISTAVVTSFAFYMWPHVFSSIYTAQSAKTLRRNSLVMPFYQLSILFVIFVGFAAFLQVPGLIGSDADLSLLKLAKASFDPWFVGVIGAAGILTALVPGSLILMATCTLLSKNIYKVWKPETTDDHLSKMARSLVPIVAAVALYFTFNTGNTILTLYLMAVNIVGQLFPAMIFSLSKKSFATATGAFAGIVCGILIVAYMSITKTTIGALMPGSPQFFQDLNIGFVAILINLIVLIAVSAVTRRATIVLEESAGFKKSNTSR